MRPASGWFTLPDGWTVPAVKSGCLSLGCPTVETVYHELAHVWDFHLSGALGARLDAAMDVERDGDGNVSLGRCYCWPAAIGARATDAESPAPAEIHGDFPSMHVNRQDAGAPAGADTLRRPLRPTS
jgi:hypothetical protein